MNEPWFDPEIFSWLPGTLLGVVGGLFGAAIGSLLTPRFKGLLFTIDGLLIFASILMFLLGCLAYFLGQPYVIWFGFGLPGVIGIVVFSGLWFGLNAMYSNLKF